MHGLFTHLQFAHLPFPPCLLFRALRLPRVVCTVLGRGFWHFPEQHGLFCLFLGFPGCLPGIGFPLFDVGPGLQRVPKRAPHLNALGHFVHRLLLQSRRLKQAQVSSYFLRGPFPVPP